MDRVFGVLAALFVLAVLVQVFLAGRGAFGTLEGEGADFGPHSLLGNVLALTSILLLVLALVARPSRRTWVLAIVLVLLAEIGQHALAAGGGSIPWLGGLHAVNGLLVLAVAAVLAAEAGRRYAQASGRASARPPDPSGPAAGARSGASAPAGAPAAADGPPRRPRPPAQGGGGSRPGPRAATGDRPRRPRPGP